MVSFIMQLHVNNPATTIGWVGPVINKKNYLKSFHAYSLLPTYST